MIIACSECDRFFTSEDGEDMCPRCVWEWQEDDREEAESVIDAVAILVLFCIMIGVVWWVL